MIGKILIAVFAFIAGVLFGTIFGQAIIEIVFVKVFGA